MKKPIKLYTVTGFLGAGKTSFLKHVLERSGDAKVGVNTKRIWENWNRW